jgi:hypothetical protein
MDGYGLANRSYFNAYFVKRQHIEKLELGGWIILGICTLGFFVVDFSLSWSVPYFGLKYSLLTLGLIYVFGLYVSEYNKSEFVKYSKRGKLINGFKYFIVLNTWIYLLRIAPKLCSQYPPRETNLF